jgi:hypothetical protein
MRQDQQRLFGARRKGAPRICFGSSIRFVCSGPDGFQLLIDGPESDPPPGRTDATTSASRRECRDNLQIGIPTGIAAINAGLELGAITFA